MPAIATYVTVA